MHYFNNISIMRKKNFYCYPFQFNYMTIDFEDIKTKVIGSSVQKPLSGTLSGHAAGEPFDKHVYNILKNKYPDKTFRQFEYLNYLFSKHPDKIGYQARQNLFDSPTVMFLLSRGKNAIDNWSIDNPFEEKQNDTADILYVDNGKYDIIDVKSRNISKIAQPPNIISAYKMAQVCAKMIDNDDFDIFNIYYFEIDWTLENDKLICKEAHYANLFKAIPDQLYINWAAALQIQFHVCDLDQDFQLDKRTWVRQYLKHFVEQAKSRANLMIKKFVEPFEKYLV